jgi:DNA-directed RNA polymerase specialized sigma24 family protein
MQQATLFARTEHGGHRVTRVPAGVLVDWPQGTRKYPNAKRAIIALVNRDPDALPTAYDPHLTFDRYFRQGRYRRVQYPALDTLTLFRSDPKNQVTITKRAAPPVIPDVLTVHVPLGIDLDRRYMEVRKIFFAGFCARVFRMGYDPEDVFQELCKGLLIRNSGKCPFDPRKSSFGHYIHMVAGCILSNYRRRYSRLSRNESFGVRTHDGEILDVAEADLVTCEPRQEGAAELRAAQRTLIPRIIREAQSEGHNPTDVEACVGYISEGHNFKETAALAGCSVSAVSSIARVIRRVAADWADTEGS